MFGKSRYYLDVKRRIGGKGRVSNIPDGYLIDLTSAREPRLYVVENELQRHEPLKHIAVQVLEFSLSFETTSQLVKSIVKQRLQESPEILKQRADYAAKNGFDNIDFLLERMIYGPKTFSALVIIDEMDPELETVLISRFQFRVEIVELKRFRASNGSRLYQFEPFLADVSGTSAGGKGNPIVDPAELDTIVVPAQEDGFQETFLGEHRWYQIRIHASMIPRLKYIAAYRTSPTSAITHVADMQDITPWKDTGKYVINFDVKARKISPVKLVPKSIVKAPQGPRYTTWKLLSAAKNLNEAF